MPQLIVLFSGTLAHLRNNECSKANKRSGSLTQPRQHLNQPSHTEVDGKPKLKNEKAQVEQDQKFIGIVIVSYCSGDYVLECLDTILASTSQQFKVVVCDNASPDNTVELLRAWARRTQADFADHAYEDGKTVPFDDFGAVTLLRLSDNLGFAGGVNAGIKALEPHDAVDLFWILNPDCQVHRDSVTAYRAYADANPGFGLMGSRLIYMDAPNQLQSDGGTVSATTGLCRNLNQGLMPDEAKTPDISALDFISGSNLVASRTYIETVGLMAEEYFLFYEEVDWAARRGALPFLWCPDALVYHHGGTVIGSGAVRRTPTAFANYFNFRNRVWYMRKFHPMGLPTAYIYMILKIFQFLLRRKWKPAMGAFRGAFGLPPSREIAGRLSESARKRAFGKPPKRG